MVDCHDKRCGTRSCGGCNFHFEGTFSKCLFRVFGRLVLHSGVVHRRHQYCKANECGASIAVSHRLSERFPSQLMYHANNTRYMHTYVCVSNVCMLSSAIKALPPQGSSRQHSETDKKISTLERKTWLPARVGNTSCCETWNFQLPCTRCRVFTYSVGYEVETALTCILFGSVICRYFRSSCSEICNGPLSTTSPALICCFPPVVDIFCAGNPDSLSAARCAVKNLRIFFVPLIPLPPRPPIIDSGGARPAARRVNRENGPFFLMRTRTRLPVKQSSTNRRDNLGDGGTGEHGERDGDGAGAG